MHKRTMTYTDFDGNERTETFYFHLSKADIVEMEFEQDGGMSSFLQRIVEEQDPSQLIRMFKKIVLLAYGEKSEDGTRFVKNDRVREDFASTAAYSELFMLLATDEAAASEFVNGIFPGDVLDMIKQAEAKKEIEKKSAESSATSPVPPTAS